MAIAEEFDHARDYAAIALEYAKEAAAEKNSHLFCKYVRLAAQRHLNDLKKAADGWDYYFDEWHANDVCDFVEKLPHVEGVWENPYLHLEPWQIFILACVFGWRRVDNGNRRFTYVYEELARKGAKSTKTAAVTLYTLTCEGEVGPQILIGATTGEQAGKVFNPAKRMVDKTPDLADCFGLQTYARSITCADNDGFIQPVNSKGKTQDGWNPHCVVLDELHAHADRALFDVMKSAFGARKNYLMWIITTAGYNLGGICYEQRQTVAKVLQGALQADHIFAIIFTIDENDDPFNPDVWVKANPMIGITPTGGLQGLLAERGLLDPATLAGARARASTGRSRSGGSLPARSSTGTGVRSIVASSEIDQNSSRSTARNSGAGEQFAMSCSLAPRSRRSSQKYGALPPRSSSSEKAWN